MLEKLLKSAFFAQNRTKIIKAACLLAAVIIASFFYFGGNRSDDEEIVTGSSENEVVSEEPAQTEPETVTVDIAGAVGESKVVTLPYGSRVADAIAECGGVTDDADLSTVNRAAVLNDGEKIYIPTEEEVSSGITYKADEETLAATSSSGLVNINTATEEELQMLNGIGPVTAGKIVAYRESYGAFKTIEDLKEVNGIGEKTFADIKDDITV